MCLVTPTKVPYVAPEDIFCYKVLREDDGQLMTPFRKFPMELNKLYSTDDVDMAQSHELGEGFLHAYASPSYMYKNKDQYLRNGGKAGMYLAVIPKGSKFFANNDCTELCSTALKVIKKIASLESVTLFDTISTDLKNERREEPEVNTTFDTYKDSLTTMENIVKYAKDNNLYADIVRKYETFEDGSYEKNLYAYRLVVAVLTENEQNSLTEGECWYPFIRFYTGRDYWSPDDDYVKVGTILSGDTSYIVVGSNAHAGTCAGLGSFISLYGVSRSHAYFGFRSVSSYDVAKFISRHFGKLIFDLMYGCANCEYRWVDDVQ